jgi:hypothetical protein
MHNGEVVYIYICVCVCVCVCVSMNIVVLYTLYEKWFMTNIISMNKI